MKTKKIEKARGGLMNTQIKGDLTWALHNGKLLHWVPLVDLVAVDLHIITHTHINRLIAAGLIPIVTSPSLSNHSTLTNRCATVIKTKVQGDVIYGLLMAGGPKKKIFNQMIEDGFPVISTLVGDGKFVPDASDRGRLVIENVHYFRLDFTK